MTLWRKIGKLLVAFFSLIEVKKNLLNGKQNGILTEKNNDVDDHNDHHQHTNDLAKTECLSVNDNASLLIDFMVHI